MYLQDCSVWVLHDVDMHINAPVPQACVLTLQWHHHEADHVPVLARLHGAPPHQGLQGRGPWYSKAWCKCPWPEATIYLERSRVCVCVWLQKLFYMFQTGSDYNHKAHEMQNLNLKWAVSFCLLLPVQESESQRVDLTERGSLVWWEFQNKHECETFDWDDNQQR